MLRYTPIPLVCERVVDVCDRVRPAVGVLSEVPVTVGVPEGVVPSVPVGSQCLARVYTTHVILGITYVFEEGSIMNKTSCLGITTGGGENPEYRAEVYPRRLFVS